MKECLKCNHVWKEEVPNPIACPRCKSTKWFEPIVYEVRRKRKIDGTKETQPQTKPIIKEVDPNVITFD